MTVGAGRKFTDRMARVTVNAICLSVPGLICWRHILMTARTRCPGFVGHMTVCTRKRLRTVADHQITVTAAARRHGLLVRSVAIGARVPVRLFGFQLCMTTCTSLLGPVGHVAVRAFVTLGFCLDQRSMTAIAARGRLVFAFVARMTTGTIRMHVGRSVLVTACATGRGRRTVARMTD